MQKACISCAGRCVRTPGVVFAPCSGMDRDNLCCTRWSLPAERIAIVGLALFLNAACHLHPGPVIRTSAVAVGGTIAGIVHATKNTVALNGRTVAAVNIATGERFETKTGLNGGYTIQVPEATYRLEVELREGETLAKQPATTRIKSGDLDPGRNFEVTAVTVRRS